MASKTGFEAGKKRPRKRKRKNYTKTVLNKIRSTKNRDTRIKIIKALARVDTHWVNKVLLEALDDPCVEIREIIIEELGRRADTIIELVCEKLTRLPWYVKSGSLRILGIKKDPQTIKYIAPLINEMNVDVRLTTAQVLGEIGGKEAVALLAELVKDNNHFVRASAEKALRKASDLKFS